MGADDDQSEEAIRIRAKLAKPFVTRLKDDIDELHAEGKIEVDGKSMITHLVSMYWGMRGLPENLQDIALLPFMQKLGINSAEGSVLTSLIFTPWAMKPFFALISDLFGFGFYKKRWYMCLIAALGGFAALMVGTREEPALAANGAVQLLLYFLLINTCIAMCDSLSQGKYTEICKWKGGTVVSFVSSSKIAAGLLGGLFGPIVNDTFGPQVNLIALTPFFIQGSIVTGMNFMGDIKLPSCCSFDKEVWTKDFKIVCNGLALGISAALLVVFRLGNFRLWGTTTDPSEACNDPDGYGCICSGESDDPGSKWLEPGTDTAFTTASPDFLLMFSGFGVLFNLGMTFWSLPKKIALINVYIIFCRIAALDVRYVLQQWYTAQAETCPVDTSVDPPVDRFPRFPNTVYQMMGLVLGALMTLVGIWLFENYVYYWNAQAAFWVTTLFTVVAAFFDISMLTQFNRTMWGWLPFMGSKITLFCTEGSCAKADSPGGAGYRLDDMFGFLIGMQALKPIATTLDDMPSTVLLSKLCPAGVETTVFAILAALMNLGLTVSGLLAGKFFNLVDVNIAAGGKTECGASVRIDQARCELGKPPEWIPLPAMNGVVFALVVGGMILPLTTIPATFCLIPNKPLNGNFIDDEDAQEVELQDPMDPSEPPHAAVAFGKQSPSFASLAGATAPKEELESASALMFNRRSGSALLSGSRMM